MDYVKDNMAGEEVTIQISEIRDIWMNMLRRPKLSGRGKMIVKPLRIRHSKF